MSEDRGRAATLQAASLLLGYPDRELLERLPLLTSVAAALPETSGRPLGRFLAHVQAQSLDALATAYVDTFDLRRRCCLYLTYYTYGDTRKRGMALLRFTHAYRAAGFELAGDELPDHLAVVCEFAAGAGAPGVRLLTEHRPGIELLRMALDDAGSAYVDVIDAIRGLLPSLTQRDLARALDLARHGPPEEEVGLEPFAPPEVMPPAEARR